MLNVNFWSRHSVDLSISQLKWRSLFHLQHLPHPTHLLTLSACSPLFLPQYLLSFLSTSSSTSPTSPLFLKHPQPFPSNSNSLYCTFFLCLSNFLQIVNSANMAAFYGVYHGPDGLKKIASRVHNMTSATGEQRK